MVSTRNKRIRTELSIRNPVNSSASCESRSRTAAHATKHMAATISICFALFVIDDIKLEPICKVNAKELRKSFFVGKPLIILAKFGLIQALKNSEANLLFSASPSLAAFATLP